MLKRKIPDVSKLVTNIALNPIIGETKIKIPRVSKLVTSTVFNLKKFIILTN